LLALLSAFHNSEAGMPDIPRPNQNKYAIELFSIETPDPFDEARFLKNKISIERLFEQSENRIHAYPVMYALIGMAAVCDKTIPEELTADYNLINGKAVPINETYHLGMKSEVTILNMKNNVATYLLDFSYKELRGYDEYVLKDDIKAQVPYFEARRINTELSQALGSWLILGGFSSSKEDGIESTYYIIRITKPSINQF
jgi:hypothetical protein